MRTFMAGASLGGCRRPPQAFLQTAVAVPQEPPTGHLGHPGRVPENERHRPSTAHLRTRRPSDQDEPDEERTVDQWKRKLRVEGRAAGEQNVHLTRTDRSLAVEVAPAPQHLVDLAKLADHRELLVQDPVGNDRRMEDPAALEQVDPMQAVHDAPRPHPDRGAREPSPDRCDPGVVEPPRAAELLALRRDPDIEGIRHRGLRMPLQLGYEELQPAWMPDVVVTRPREVAHAGAELAREPVRREPVLDHPPATRAAPDVDP